MLTLRRRGLIRAGIAATSVGALGRRARAQQSGPIELPILMPMSGFAESMGSQVNHGAELTAEYINSNGGVAGRQVKLRFMDDKGHPTDAAAAAREAISNGFNIIGGGLLTSDILAMEPILQENNAVMISPSGSGVALTHEAFSRNLFNCMENDYLRARSLARLASEKFPNITRWAGINSDQANYFQSYQIFQKFAEQYYGAKGIKVTFEPVISAKFGTSDFRPQIQQLSASSAEGLYNIVVGGDSLTLWQQARGLGVNTKFKAVLDQSLDFAFIKGLKKNMPANLWTLVGWYAGLYPNDKIAQDFYTLYKNRTGDAYPSAYIQYGNFAVAVIAAAIEAAQGHTDTASIIRATENLKMQTIKGPAEIRASDHLWIGDINFVNYLAIDEEPGFKIVDSFKLDANEMLPPSDPGKPFVL